MKKFDKMRAILASIQIDADKFYGKGSKAAGARLRKGMLALKVLAQEVRVEVSAIKNKDKEV